MIKVILDHNHGFAIQRQTGNTWRTIQRVADLEQVEFVLSRLNEPLHPLSLGRHQRRARAMGGVV